MRSRAVIVLALLAAPVGLSAQTLPTRAPPRSAAPPVRPTEPSPQPAAVARALQYRRARWSAETYSVITTTQVPTGPVLSRYTSFGNGLRGDYRYTDHWSMTVDMTTSYLFSPAITETGELGARYAPLTLDHQVRPFFDARVAFMHMYDSYQSDIGPTINGGFGGDYFAVGRYMRGFGSAVGAGFEFPLTESLQLTNEVSGMRSRMTAYRLSGGLPTGTAYWMNAFRYSIGIKLNPIRTMHLDQNPMK
ncbi:MAG TPA: hypothetical protein VGQ44_02445 [Gemmatimonadaceae bacterium]|jgi:hypothetical protein|nr:hypothetical protein [Gemmatimonadaceae bacterium]